MSDDPELVDLNRRISETLSAQPALWEVPVEVARLGRERGTSVFGPIETSDRAETATLATAVGEVPVRVIRPNVDPAGIYVHFHGGGWVLGATHHQDRRLVALADATAQTVVSIDYRLAPEDPWPAGPDDCEAAAVAIIEDPSGFGPPAFTFGGESAGAHLALVTLLRLRDRHDWVGAAAANLLYGCFDLRGTPSVRLWDGGPQVLTGESMLWFVDRFLVEGTDRSDPDISPLLADLGRLPPAIFTVGTVDPLLDDTLFMHSRWRMAGLDAELWVHPGAPHAFDAFDVDAGRRALDRINSFLATRLGSVR